jgi:DNA-binding NtrC family response regulator
MRTVLVIDDTPAVGQALELLFRLHDIRTLAASTPGEGLATLARERIDLVIADMNFSADTTSGEEGEALFRAIRESCPDLPVILLTAWTHLESAVRLVKEGAADYLGKPWDNDKLLATIENLLELSESTRSAQQLQSERRLRRRRLAQQYDLRSAVFESQAMESAIELACRVARAAVPVLITGPNGAGKERIAEIVHANSGARSGPFIALNCGAIPTELVEAELFGAEAGAYTGAHRARIGRFEAADGGTLFLDEIGNLPLTGQVKLLRVLETGQFEQLGSSRTRQTHARIVSATNADLAALIREGRFREDLYYRLNVIEIAVPALAERVDDIVPLAEHFLGASLRLSDEAVAALLAHDWPGNVRELRNSIERAKLLARDSLLQRSDLNLPAAASRAGAPPSTLPGRDGEHLSRESIEASLRAAAGNVSRAAHSLGLSRQALYRRMERFGLRSPSGS